MANLRESFVRLIAQLRAMNLNYHHAHVLVKGPTYAGDHALLQRFYFGEDADGAPILEIDSLMERAQGLFPLNPIGPTEVYRSMQPFVVGLLDVGIGQWWGLLLELENALQDALTVAIAMWEKYPLAGDPSLAGKRQGVINLLQGVADAHQINIYLLQQRATT